MNSDRLIGSEEVAARLGLHRDTVVKRARNAEAHPTFPRPLRYQPGSKRGRLFWRESVINKYISEFGKEGGVR
jgi:predicted DNA-binding transcriptional regulator AlpA